MGPTNIFRRLSKFTADLLVRETPSAGQEEGAFTDAALLMLAHSLATDAIRYGYGVLVLTSTAAGPIARIVDARYVLQRTGGGWVFVEPRVRPGSESTFPNALEFTVVTPTGETMVMLRERGTSALAHQYTAGPVVAAGPLGMTTVWPVPALPTVAGGNWGTSWFEDIITIAAQKSRRMAANTTVLDEHTNPLLLLRGDLDRYTTIPGVPRSNAVSSAETPQDIERETAVTKRLRAAGAITLPDGVEAAEYVTWDGQLVAAMAQLAEIDKEFQFLSGLPSALSSIGEIPSGMSLRRMFWQFDAAVSPIFHLVHNALTRALATQGLTLEWESALESVEDTPTENAREDVENEATARRGEGNGPPE